MRLPHAVAALAVVLALAAPSLAEFKPASGSDAKATTKNAFRSNLKWRSAAGSTSTEAAPAETQVSTEQPASEPTEAGSPAAAEPATTGNTTESTSDMASSTSTTGSKSVLRLTIRTPQEKVSAPAEMAEPASFEELAPVEDPAPVKKAAPVAAAPKAAKPRSRGYVQRLSDAEPSPHSLGANSTKSNTATIKRTSNEEPQLDPFGDDGVKLSARPRTNDRAVRVGMQDRAGAPTRNPFGDEPQLERVPNGQAPQRGSSEEYAQGPRALPYNCPTPKEYVKKLADISTNIAAEPGEFPAECGLGDEAFQPRNWNGMLFAWKASALCHKPLYFEDIELERYGQTCSPLFQPIISAAKFYITLPILPYMMGLEPPCECIYPLGYYRPGSCAPFIIPPVPISLRGALLEAGVWVAGVALVP